MAGDIINKGSYQNSACIMLGDVVDAFLTNGAVTVEAWRSLPVAPLRQIQVIVDFICYDASINVAGEYFSQRLERGFFRSAAGNLTAVGAASAYYTKDEIAGGNPSLTINADSVNQQVYLEANGKTDYLLKWQIEMINIKVME